MKNASPIRISTAWALSSSSTSAKVTATPAAPFIPIMKGEREFSGWPGFPAAGLPRGVSGLDGLPDRVLRCPLFCRGGPRRSPADRLAHRRLLRGMGAPCGVGCGLVSGVVAEADSDNLVVAALLRVHEVSEHEPVGGSRLTAGDECPRVAAGGPAPGSAPRRTG